MKTEEDAFWMLAVLLENVLVNNCYTNNLSGCHVEQRVFKDFLARMCPRVAAHLDALEFDVSLFATDIASFLRACLQRYKKWGLFLLLMKEQELLLTYHLGDVINILQKTTHHLFDPDELLTFQLQWGHKRHPELEKFIMKIQSEAGLLRNKMYFKWNVL